MKPAADAVLVLITLIWGVTFVVVKDALAHADPFTFLGLRFGLAAVVAVALVHRRVFDRKLWAPASILAVFLFTGYELQTWGLVWTSPSRSAFVDLDGVLQASSRVGGRAWRRDRCGRPLPAHRSKYLAGDAPR